MYFQIVRTRAGYHVRIRGANHEIVFTTEVYVSRASAMNAIALVQTGARTAPVYEVDESRY